MLLALKNSAVTATLGLAGNASSCAGESSAGYINAHAPHTPYTHTTNGTPKLLTIMNIILVGNSGTYLPPSTVLLMTASTSALLVQINRLMIPTPLPNIIGNL